MIPLRDLAVVVIVFGLLPFIFTRPWLGVLLWTWIGTMNPHRLGWSFAFDLPLAMVVGVVTLVAFVFSREKKVFPMVPETAVLLCFLAWMTFTTFFALYPNLAWEQWEKVMKIQLFILVTLMVMNTRQRIELLIWVSTLSLVFFGVKGGIYTFSKEGGGMVLGPRGGFIEGNTTIALAVVVALPLMRYLQLITKQRWARWTLGGAMIISTVAVLGTYSRGALLAVVAMGFFLWLKSRQKMAISVLLVALVPALLIFMPDAWHDRMESIRDYQQDGSSLGRLNAWQFAYNLAKDRPVGGGYETFQKPAFQVWAPEPARVHDAHSIWFEVLGEHGFIGLALYLLLCFFTWRRATAIIRLARDRPELGWADELARLIQVALVGFWVGGSFLGLADWDYPYLLMVMLVVTDRIVRAEVAASNAQARPPAFFAGASVQPHPQR